LPPSRSRAYSRCSTPTLPIPRYIIGGDLYKGIRSRNTIYLGEEGLNLTHLGDVRRLVYAGNLSVGIDVPDRTSFDPVYDGDFVTGRYDAWGQTAQIAASPGWRLGSRRQRWASS
jgi:hypothetical protein